MNRAGIMAACAAAVIASPFQAAIAQDGPSLEVTLNFIRDKLTGQGVVSYTSNFTDTATNNTWVNNFVEEYTNLEPNISACKLSYHYKETRDGQTLFDGDPWILFAQVSDIQMTSRDVDLRRLDTLAGHPTFTAVVSPPIFVLRVIRQNNRENDFTFSDEALADRVAKAMAHAAQLCGGLKPEPF